MATIINLKWVNQNQKSIIMNNQLEFLLRKNKGKSKQTAYKRLFLDSGFVESELTYIGLEQADEIVKNINNIFSKVQEKAELIPGTIKQFEYSRLLNEIDQENDGDSGCYIFTTNYKYCGMYLVKLRRALACALIIAKKDYQNLFFIVDKGFKYSISIHYNDESHIDDPVKFDIQSKEIC